MKYLLSSIVALVLVSATLGYTPVKEPNDLYLNTFYKNYVLAVMHNSETTPLATKAVHKMISEIESLDVVKTEGIIVQMVYTDEVKFFDESYKLGGTNKVCFFIRNQMKSLDGFHEQLIEESKSGGSIGNLVESIEKFMSNHIKGISTEISDLEHFNELLNEKKTLGIYIGEKNDHFEKYMHVARKNLDFTSVHTHEKELARTILEQLNAGDVSSEDFFGIARSAETLTVLDPDALVVFRNFEEKQLTEFLEHERYPKLRDTSFANMNTHKMFFKNQAVVLYVMGPEKEEAANYQIFREVVALMPRNMIYAVMDQDSKESASYTQMFVIGENMVGTDSLVIMYVSPSRNVKIEGLDRPFTTGDIINFIQEFSDKNRDIFDHMREHLYDKSVSRNNQEESKASGIETTEGKGGLQQNPKATDDGSDKEQSEIQKDEL